jgi:hypothetical protein
VVAPQALDAVRAVQSAAVARLVAALAAADTAVVVALPRVARAAVERNVGRT